MRRLAAVLALLLAAGPAGAVIKVLTPLKQVLDAEQMIFVAEVTKVDADRPSVTLAFAEDLKGKCGFKSLPVNLTGDSYAKKDGHTQILLDRLTTKRKMVLFVSKQGDEFSAFAFVEGTWFQMKGTVDAAGGDPKWAFLHCEPYFRRTFKGTTAELKDVVTKYLAKTGDAPAPDEKEPAGYGPKAEADKPKPPDKCGGGGALFGVIPSFVLLGPLAIVAALFPGVFAKLAVSMKRWRAFLVVASTNSTLAMAYEYVVRGYLPDAAWAGPAAFSGLLLVLAGCGLVWAGVRYRVAGAADPAITQPPTRIELRALLGVTAGMVLVVGLLAYFAGRAEVVRQPWREFTAIAAGLAAGSVYTIYRALTAKADAAAATRLSLSGESVSLGGLILFGAGVLAATAPPAGGGPLPEAVAGDAPTIRLTEITVAPFDGVTDVLSNLAGGGDEYAFGGMTQTGFRATGFVMLAKAGKPAWTFDAGGKLKPAFSTPALAADRVFVGEGLHTDSDRKLYALDRATGKELWAVPTASHTEGSPLVLDKTVVFAAGDDGLYCVTAAEGKRVWHLPGLPNRLHIDTPPAVGPADASRVYAGSGYGTLALLGIDAAAGTVVWQTPVNLRSFGKPCPAGSEVIYGLGTGNLIDDLSTEPEDGVPKETAPAGAVVAADAGTGVIRWRYDLPKSVHTAVVADAVTAYACCKDGCVYAIKRSDGKLRWKRPLGDTFTAGPAIATTREGFPTAAVYAVTRDGRAAALNPATGDIFWVRELSEVAKKAVVVTCTPHVAHYGATRRLLIGGSLTNANNGTRAAAVFTLTDAAD